VLTITVLLIFYFALRKKAYAKNEARVEHVLQSD